MSGLILDAFRPQSLRKAYRRATTADRREPVLLQCTSAKLPHVNSKCSVFFANNSTQLRR